MNTQFEVTLDRARHIQFTQRTLFRMGSLPSPFEFDDLQKPKKSYAALVAWVWACLVPADAADFPSPEDVAMHIPATREVCRKLASTLAEAVNAGASDGKNGQSSTRGTSPVSS